MMHKLQMQHHRSYSLQSWETLLTFQLEPIHRRTTSLGFAIAAHVHSDILLIDEVLAVGDQQFQRKCVAKIESFLEQNRTIILVSHDLHAVRSLCDRVLWIEQGELQMLGPATEVVDRYIQGNQQQASLLNTPKISHSPSQLSPQTLSFQSTTEDPHFQRVFMSQFGEIPVEFSPECNPVDVVEGDEAIMQGTGESIFCPYIFWMETRIQDNDSRLVKTWFRGTSGPMCPLSTPFSE